ncbi:uncharacterized protein PG986_005396 [Apiospora aurea]|uniref:Uncharacterized protein n=1 Tax=Apiospora aurea TaxID=335848 RepID=A0ABR1QHV2_9PEZI
MGYSGNASSSQNNNISNRKKASSFTGFLGKLLPTHRPEQGGTLRRLDDKSTESAYRILGINPEALNHWNIPKDLPISRRLEFEEDCVRNSSCRPEPTRPKTSPVPSRLSTPSQRPDRRLSAAETQHILRRKQRGQRKHRELKASGDWLGVTGANPHTGQYNVLTPTESVSSELTPPSTKLEMSKLTKTVRQAERNYEKAKRIEGAAREKHRMEKAQLKLDKIEQAKAVIQQQHGSLEWKKHGREWSSVREPGLSPIAQSFTNTEESENRSEEHQSENGPVISCKESKGKQPVWASPSSSSRRHEGGNKLRKRRRNAEPSADTIIHTPSRQQSGILSSPGQDPEDGGTKPDAQVSNPLRAGKHFLWGRRRRATDPGRPDTNQATVTSSLMIHQNERSQSLNITSQQDHFDGLVIPDYRLGAVTLRTAQAGQGGPRSYSDLIPVDVERAHEESLRRHPKIGPKPISHRSDGKHTRASTSFSPVPQRVRRAPSPGKSQVGARKMPALGPLKTPARPRAVDIHAEKDPADHSKDCNQERTRHGKETASKAEVRLDESKGKTIKTGSFPNEMPQDAEGERTRGWSTEIMETIKKTDGTSQNKGYAYTPITTTTGYAHALLIQPISGATLGQLDGHAIGAPDAPATRSLNSMSPRSLTSMSPRLYVKSTNRAGDRTALSRPSTMQNGSPRHGYSHLVPIFGTASARIVEIHRPKSPGGTQSRLALGTLRSKNGESRPTQRAPSPTKREVGAAQLNEKHREATVQGAARTAMVQSQGKASKVQMTRPKRKLKKEAKDKLIDEKDKGKGEKKENTDESSEKKEKGKGEATDGSQPKAQKPDAFKTLQRISLIFASWVWATLHYWWDVMHPVFDGESDLWKRRHREESTWADVGVFLFAGVSLIVGLGLGVHVLKTTQSLYQTVYYSL